MWDADDLEAKRPFSAAESGRRHYSVVD